MCWAWTAAHWRPNTRRGLEFHPPLITPTSRTTAPPRQQWPRTGTCFTKFLLAAPQFLVGCYISAAILRHKKRLGALGGITRQRSCRQVWFLPTGELPPICSLPNTIIIAAGIL